MAVRVAEVMLGLSEKRSAVEKFGSDERFATARVVLDGDDEPEEAYALAVKSVKEGIEKAWQVQTKEERSAKKGGWHLSKEDRDKIQKLAAEFEDLSGEPANELKPPKSQAEADKLIAQLKGAIFDFKQSRKGRT